MPRGRNAECGALTMRKEEESRRADAAVAECAAAVRERVEAVAFLVKQRDQLQAGIVHLQRQLATASTNEKALSDRLETAMIDLNAEQTRHARTIMETKAIASALDDMDKQLETLLREKDDCQREKQAQRKEFEGRLAEAEQELKAKQSIIKGMISERNTLRSQITDVEARLKATSKQLIQSVNQDIPQERDANLATIARLGTIIAEQDSTIKTNHKKDEEWQQWAREAEGWLRSMAKDLDASRVRENESVALNTYDTRRTTLTDPSERYDFKICSSVQLSSSEVSGRRTHHRGKRWSLNGFCRNFVS